MVRIHDNRIKSTRWLTQICPNILKKINSYINLSGVCHAICNGESKFEVKHWDNMFTVDLEKKECSCRYWQLAGLPCPHAISCLLFKTNNLESYISSCYSVESFNRTYSHCLQPIEGMSNWPESDRPKLKAPGYVRMPGRPKKERRREATEAPKGTKMSKVGTKIRCSKCKQTGHNKSTCDKKSASVSSQSNAAQNDPVGSQSNVGPNVKVQSIPNHTSYAIVPMSNTQESSSSTRKRKAPNAINKVILLTIKAPSAINKVI